MLFKLFRKLIRPKHNFKKISGHMYKVYNQNGLNNALYDYFSLDGDSGYSKERVRKMLHNWPRHYPCKVIIVDQSFECARVYLEIL